MNTKLFIFASALTVAVTSACREPENHTTSTGRAEPLTNQPAATGDMRQDTAKTPEAPGMITDTTANPGAVAGTEDRAAKAEAKREEYGEAPDLAQDAAAGTATPKTAKSRTLGTASLKSHRSKAIGSATFSGDDAALTKVMIDVKNAPKGTYQVHVLDGKDCAAIEGMETPYAGGPGVAGEGKVGTPGPKTTMALWQSLGSMTVDETGTGKIAVDVKDAKGAKLDQRLVVIYPEKSADKNAPKQAVIACGPVKAGAADLKSDEG